VTLTNLTQSYDGYAKPVSATTNPAGRLVTFTYDDSATVILSDLHQVADGSPRVVIATTAPPDLDVAITYGGNPTAPTATGSYAAVATITDPLYEGSANGTLVVDDPATMTLINGGQLTALSALGALDVETHQIARHEVTRSFWNTVRDWAIANGYDLAAIGTGPGDHPVHSVSWYDAIKWCNARTEWENATFGRSLAPAYRIGTAVFKTGAPDPATILLDEGTSGYRLPSATEWEYAARRGLLGTGQNLRREQRPRPRRLARWQLRRGSPRSFRRTRHLARRTQGDQRSRPLRFQWQCRRVDPGGESRESIDATPSWGIMERSPRQRRTDLEQRR
jgi:hypothetical protein